MNEINKPLTIARNELLEDIVAAINKAALPAFIVSELLKNVTLSVDKLAQEQLERDTREYQEALNRLNAGEASLPGEVQPGELKNRHRKGGGVNGRR